MSFAAPKVERPYMPHQHHEFYRFQPFLVVAARDKHNHMSLSLLFASNLDDQVTSFMSSPSPTTQLSVDARALPGDAILKGLGSLMLARRYDFR
jgi:hypothetical protein